MIETIGRSQFMRVATKVFDTYWRFAGERQAIFFRRLRGFAPPWSADPIFRDHKFTNAYRASDRVSQFLIRHVIYEGDQEPEELFFRIILFKLFNKIETWRLLSEGVGPISFRDYEKSAYDRVLTSALQKGTRIYSAAYIMPSGSRAFRDTYKHRAHLHLLDRMMEDEVALRLADLRSMRDAFRLLRSYPLMGDFLAYQYVTDLNYSPLLNFSEMDFVVAGPGARSGIAKCFPSTGGCSDADVIRIVADAQEEEFQKRGVDFRSLWGRSLQLVDCQNLFCEVDKYARLRHPEIAGARTRIKQRFRANREPIIYWYPPKWGINQRASAREESNGS